jgi:hypothetical protein
MRHDKYYYIMNHFFREEGPDEVFDVEAYYYELLKEFNEEKLYMIPPGDELIWCESDRDYYPRELEEITLEDFEDFAIRYLEEFIRELETKH